ncbi:hypothetical protein PIB30_022064 [Stylosanthes scabra]|uniref:Uncharacterized protein n=1 Tax=Stylosanthes scabra TaxID=79078 RepID=A0ABU6Q9C7_9FABA|nr:hypothetical protein [Stylosanthes scabra]
MTFASTSSSFGIKPPLKLHMQNRFHSMISTLEPWIPPIRCTPEERDISTSAPFAMACSCTKSLTLETGGYFTGGVQGDAEIETVRFLRRSRNWSILAIVYVPA